MCEQIQIAIPFSFMYLSPEFLSLSPVVMQLESGDGGNEEGGGQQEEEGRLVRELVPSNVSQSLIIFILPTH